jgi:hypothetical protein
MVTPPRLWAALGLLLILAIALFLILFQWNWLRGPLARLLSEKLDRPVAIFGNLEVHPWSWSPTATVNGVVVGNPPWAGRAPMASLPRLKVKMKLTPLLLHGKLVFPWVEADRPDFTLLRDGSGRANWRFGPGGGAHAPAMPVIDHLVIGGGKVRYDDATRRLRFSGILSSTEEVAGSRTGTFQFTGQGTLRGAPFTLTASGGPLVNVDTNRPYPFVARIASGPTRVSMSASFARPFDFNRISGQIRARGPDLAGLYGLTNVSLPNTPPYNLAGGFARVHKYYAFRRIHGRVGDSDLAGALSVDDTKRRPFLRANLASRRLRLADLTAVIGGAPSHPRSHTLSPAQKVMATHLAAQHRMLPDATLDVRRIRAADARLIYRAETVDAGKAPVRALSLKLVLDRGLLTVDPLRVSLPQGDLSGLIRLNARAAMPVTGIDLRLVNARLENFVKRQSGVPPVEGGLFAHAALTGIGGSVRAAAATANGNFTVAMPGGQIRKALAELMGIDAANGIFLLITKDHGQTPIRCAVANFRAQNGVLGVQSMIVDTGVVQARGAGAINLRNETMNLALYGKNKKFRFIRIAAPITIKGSLASPKFGVDIAKAAPQAGIAVALGALVSPLAAVLPFIGPPLAKDADCAGLIGAAEARGAPVGRRL